MSAMNDNTQTFEPSEFCLAEIDDKEFPWAEKGKYAAMIVFRLCESANIVLVATSTHERDPMRTYT
jgi:hypothetical protein